MHCSETKLRRKRAKYCNILNKDFGIALSEVPTKNLMICNGGLVNGIDQERVFITFNEFGTVEGIFMVPGKSYCFISFTETSSAEAALRAINNKKIWAEIKGLIYLAYMEQIPDLLRFSMNFKEKPPGLFVLEDFVTDNEEQIILTCLKNYSLSNEETKSASLKHRKVSHFGYEFKYSKNNVDANEPIKDIPKELDFIWDKVLRISSELGIKLNCKPDQLTVNNYQPGQGIPAHVDTHSAFEDPITSLSLQSPVIMEFKNSKGKSCNVLLPARSMCIMTGESRYGWTHGIVTRKSDIVLMPNGGLNLQYRRERTSLTFRKIRQKNCSCKFPEFCDTQKTSVVSDDLSFQVREDVASRLENSYVHQVYSKISDHFSETRHKPWPNVLKFVNKLPVGSILLDVGCGNGKYFGKGKNSFEIGCDSSSALVEVCRKRGFECFSCNCLNLPIRDGVIDGCISIAVIHHLVTMERRKRALEEMIRVLRPGGFALVYVWSKNQMRHEEKSSYLKQKTSKRNEDSCEKRIVVGDNLSLPVHKNRTDFLHNDLLVPWKLKNFDSKETTEPPVYLRFYHVFEDDELKNLCSTVAGAEIADYYYDQGNWCVLLQKI